MSRMAINSLLNEDKHEQQSDPILQGGPTLNHKETPIILAPHLRTKVPAAAQSPFSPLDALVHAASEEHHRTVHDPDPPSPSKRPRHSNDDSTHHSHSTSPYQGPQQGLRSPSFMNSPVNPDPQQFLPAGSSPPSATSHFDSPLHRLHSHSRSLTAQATPHFVEPSHFTSPVQPLVAPGFATASSDGRIATDHHPVPNEPKPIPPPTPMDVDQPQFNPVPLDNSNFQPSDPSGSQVPQRQLPVDHTSARPYFDVTHQDTEALSMPPPTVSKSKKHTNPGAPRKKPGPKPKPKTATDGVKPRKKPGPKPKARNSDGTLARDNASSSSSKVKATTPGSSSRSRSTSVMLHNASSVGPEGGEPQEPEKEGELAPDKLYCVCETPYDDGKLMIACDSCDEWYHTSCVDMPDLVVDLVDQFFCPICTSKNPDSNLRTTYKQQCLKGVSHPHPDSPEACHRAARGAFSKYCSDDCGMEHMRSRIQDWEKSGGQRENLWEVVREAEKPEGVVVRVVGTGTKSSEIDGTLKTKVDGEIVRPATTRVLRETERLQGLLDHVVKLREDISKGMETLVWREKLLECATARAEHSGLCGWDQRLCFGDEEIAEFGDGVLDSYPKNSDPDPEDQEEMQVDEGEWWCPGDKVCDRHAGWQSIRYKDICKEKDQKEEGLAKLTTREREIRKRIEDISEATSSTLKSSRTTNGRGRSRVNGDASKKSRKRKGPIQ